MISMEQTDAELIKNWLKTQTSESTKVAYKYHIEVFREWFKKPFKAIFEMPADERRNLALEYQAFLRERDQNQNTVVARMTALQSLCAFKGFPLLLKRKRLKSRMDIDSHMFYNEDLQKMFSAANVEQKAILAAFLSTGWEISGIIGMKKAHIESLIKKAKEQNEEVVFFDDVRSKTDQPRLGILNPIAIEAISDWLRDEKCVGPALFNYRSKEGVNTMIKHLCRDSGVTTTGRIHTHSLRKWVMSGLSRGGLNEWQTKYVVGKKIPASDYTYLQTLNEEVKERYPTAFETTLDFRLPTNLKKIEIKLAEKDREIAELKQKLEQNGSSLRMENESLEKRLRSQEADLKAQASSTEQKVAKLEKMIHDVLEKIS